MAQSPLYIAEFTMEMAFPPAVLDQVAKAFGPEKAREAAMSTSVGGIGPLLKDRVFGQSELGLDVIGISLLYEKVWMQAWHEWGQLNLQKRTIGPELRNILNKTDLGFVMTGYDGKPINVDVWHWAYGQANIYFLSSPEITEVVYPGPKDAPKTAANPHVWSHDARLKQSWLLGRGGLHLCKKIGRQPDVAVMSETPTIFSHHRIVTDELQNDPFFENVRYVFNDHTPLEYAHPIWDLHTIELVKLDPNLYLKSLGWNPSKKTLDITSLLVGMCDGVFGVARKHGEVMRAMSSLRDFTDRIKYITNGVRKEDWQAPGFSSWESLSDDQLINVKQQLKKELLDWVWRRCRLWKQWALDAQNKSIAVLTRRITPYKRLDVLVKMVDDPEWRARFLKLDMIIFVGGRIHQQDNHAQDIVYDLLELVQKDEQLRERIIFLDNFNIWEAHRLYKGADGSIMMADDTREASATGFMKAQLNGAAVIATSDGAVPEFVQFEGQPPALTRIQEIDQRVNGTTTNGFFIPYLQGQPTPDGLLTALEKFDEFMKDPKKRAAVMRASLAYTPILDISRTSQEMKDFFEKMLAPLPRV